MQSDRNSFCSNVLDSVNVKFMNEDNMVDRIKEKQISSDVDSKGFFFSK